MAAPAWTVTQPQPPSQRAGMVFLCTPDTMWDVYQLRLFGAPKSRLPEVKRLRHGSPLFLHDMQAFNLAGPYWAVGDGGENLDPSAWPVDDKKSGSWVSRYPAQVRVKPDDMGTVALPAEEWQSLVTWTEYDKFDPSINAWQATQLVALFRARASGGHYGPPQMQMQAWGPSAGPIPYPDARMGPQGPIGGIERDLDDRIDQRLRSLEWRGLLGQKEGSENNGAKAPKPTTADMREAMRRFGIAEPDIRITPAVVWEAAEELSGVAWRELRDQQPQGFRDPCPLPPVPDRLDGLRDSWGEPGALAFVNPPFTQMVRWMRKALVEHRKGVGMLIVLSDPPPPRPGQQESWVHSAEGRAEIAKLHGHKLRGLKGVHFDSPAGGDGSTVDINLLWLPPAKVKSAARP